MRKWLIILCTLALALACNFPGFPAMGPTLPDAETTPPDVVPEDTGDEDNPDGGQDKPDPPPLETATPEGESDSLTSTSTATPTATTTPTPTSTPTPEPIVPGPPLAFKDPAWELVEWHKIEGTGEWEGTIRIHVSGGTAPYRCQLENKEIVSGLEVPARWRLCKAMPATIRVWSADEQHVQTAIWVGELGCQ